MVVAESEKGCTSTSNTIGFLGQAESPNELGNHGFMVEPVCLLSDIMRLLFFFFDWKFL